MKNTILKLASATLILVSLFGVNTVSSIKATAQDNQENSQSMSTLTFNEIDETVIDCVEGLAGSETKCYIKPPKNKTLSEKTEISIGTEDNFGGECKEFTEESGKITFLCSNIPTPPKSGFQDVYIKFDDNSITKLQDTGVRLNSEISPFRAESTLEMQNATSLQCEPNPALKGSTINCSGSLPSHITPPVNEDLNMGVEGLDQVICDFESANPGSSFTCQNISVGSEVGRKRIMANVGDTNAEFTGVIITVQEESTPTQPTTPEPGQEGSIPVTENPQQNQEPTKEVARSGGLSFAIIITIISLSIAYFVYQKISKKEPPVDYKKLNPRKN